MKLESFPFARYFPLLCEYLGAEMSPYTFICKFSAKVEDNLMVDSDIGGRLCPGLGNRD